MRFGDSSGLLDPSAADRNASADMIKAADLIAKAREPETVVVAELPDGRQLKITGYERAAIWARRPETAPLQVNVMVVRVADAAEAARLYDEFGHLLAHDMM